MIQLDLQREITMGWHGGSSEQPVHIVLLICKLLVNGTSTSAVAANIKKMSYTMTGNKVNESPCIILVRKCRVDVKNLNSTLAKLRLGDADEWHHLFTNGMPRLQIYFQNLVISVMVDSKRYPVIVLPCMFLQDETSKNQVNSIVKQVIQDVDIIRQRIYL